MTFVTTINPFQPGMPNGRRARLKARAGFNVCRLVINACVVLKIDPSDGFLS